MGNACMRDCERVAQEAVPADEKLREKLAQDVETIRVEPMKDGNAFNTLAFSRADCPAPVVSQWNMQFNHRSAENRKQGTAQREGTAGFDEAGNEEDGCSTGCETLCEVKPNKRDDAGAEKSQVRELSQNVATKLHSVSKVSDELLQSVYDGEVKNGSRHGFGCMAWDDGRQYRGQFEEGKFHGFASMSWPDGRKYCGQYVEDRKHGRGTLVWRDGRCYEGQWVVGKRHGIGVYTNAKGLTRRGLWQMDQPLHWEEESVDNILDEDMVGMLPPGDDSDPYMGMLPGALPSLGQSKLAAERRPLTAQDFIECTDDDEQLGFKASQGLNYA